MAPSGPLLGLALFAGMASRLSAQAVTMDLGGLTLRVSTSRTAQTFHVVDQLSAWSSATHKAYTRWAARALSLDAVGQALLARHAALRQQRGWGKGFEQAFLSDSSIPAAAATAVQAGWLTPPEAAAEDSVLTYFAPRLAPLFEQQQTALEAFEQALLARRAELATLMEQLQHFALVTEPVTVPVYLVANPEVASGGGEANGGRLVVEVPSPSAIGFLLHESLHFLLSPQEATIHQAATAAGLDPEVLDEGIAFGLAPGLTEGQAPHDLLMDQIVRAWLAGASPTARGPQIYLLAGVLRPLLRATLTQGGTLTTFLPQATAQWKSVTGH
jgi:hypothetical protein